VVEWLNMATRSNADTVTQIYEAFGRGDVQFILAQLASDVAWEHWEHGNSAQDAGVPYLQERKGSEGVMGFFQAIGETLDISGFQVQGVHGDGDIVFGRFLIEATNRATGRSLVDEEVHVWEFGPDGKVVRFRHVVDTGKHVAASKP
jgi:ketosteroid isomerase-like protein